jgi:DNA-binding NarL/FixJ family response regulator
MLNPLNPKDGRVLLVEDNPDDVVLETKALQTFGIKTIYHASTAEEALEFLQKHTCDVVLLDYNLPGANGLKLLEHVRELNPDMRVILVTGVRDERVAVSGFKLGVTDYVSKDELLTSGIIRALQGAMRGQQESREQTQRDLLGSGDDKLRVAAEEIDWLLDTIAGGSPHGKPSEASALAGEEGWIDIRDVFVRYLKDCFDSFPEPAVLDEDGLVRMFLERGSSTTEVLAIYRATVRALAVEQVEPPFDPIICLVRLLGGLVDHYQRELALEVMRSAV